MLNLAGGENETYKCSTGSESVDDLRFPRGQQGKYCSVQGCKSTSRRGLPWQANTAFFIMICTMSNKLSLNFQGLLFCKNPICSSSSSLSYYLGGKFIVSQIDKLVWRNVACEHSSPQIWICIVSEIEDQGAILGLVVLASIPCIARS